MISLASSLGGNEGRTSSNAGHVVVLGDDPKPRPPPARRGRGRLAGRGEGSRGLYNHCKISRRIHSASTKGWNHRAEVLNCLCFWLPARRERWRAVAGRAGGRRRRGGRVDRGHVGRHGLHHARRHGVALAAMLQQPPQSLHTTQMSDPSLQFMMCNVKFHVPDNVILC